MTTFECMTDAQQRDLVDCRARWFAIGSCCDPADRPRAEAAIAAMYGRIQQPRPRFLWVDSPAHRNVITRAVGTAWALGLLSYKQAGASISNKLRDLVVALVASLGATFARSLRVPEAPLWAALRAPLVASLWDSLNNLLRDSLVLRGARGDPLFWGQMESGWIAIYQFARDVLAVQYEPECNAQLDLWAEIAQSCGWWWPCEGLVVISERPTTIRWESDRDPPRLHCADGPAVRFRDGYCVHAWRGTRVPARLIEDPESYTAQDIRAETNSEVVRALAARIGWQRLLEKADAQLVDVWLDQETKLSYELRRADLGHGRAMQFLRMQSPKCNDGSQPFYLEKVHPALMTAQAARKWQFPYDPQTGTSRPMLFRHGDVVVGEVQSLAAATRWEWPSPDDCNQNPTLTFDEEV
jgi:hypothetical protein